jgi:hypothetical protein
MLSVTSNSLDMKPVVPWLREDQKLLRTHGTKHILKGAVGAN